MATPFQAKVQAAVEERTHRDVVRFSLKWTIENFRSFQDQTEIMYSSGITMKDLGPDVAKEYQGRWRIRITPCFKTTEDSVETKYLSVYLWLQDSSVESSPYKGKDICTDFHTSVTTGKAMNTAIFNGSASNQVFSDKTTTWGYYKLVTHKRLLGAEKEPGLLQDDRITIAMDVLMYKKPKTEEVPEISKPRPARVREFTRRQMEWLRADHHRQFTDLVLVSNDNKEFPVHRFALMAHSPVFEVMFTHDLKEKKLSRCELKDVDGESVELLLDYVYGCDVGKITSGNAEKVLIMADKYGMMELRASCEHVLISNVPVDKAIHYLVLAGQRGLSNLKEAALSVMPKNMATVLQNGGLDEAVHFDSNLLVTIMEYCAGKMRVVDDVQRSPSPEYRPRRLRR